MAKQTQRKQVNNIIEETSRIIAVGASAGGLEALKAFFKHIPATDKNAYVVIQHLSPDYKSMMGELLAKSAHLPIEEIEDEKQIEPGKIYLIPPVNNLEIDGKTLHLKPKPKSQKLNLPIDIFLNSLAKNQQDKAIAIILSGTGSDGTRGIRAIKEHGGLVMVQDPQQAKFDGMPQSALHTGLVDYTLPVEEMGAEIRDFIQAPLVLKIDDNNITYDEKTLFNILSLVHQETGLDFKEYKHATLARRIARRINVCKCNSLEEYLELLHNTPEEIPILYREFLIGVTKFFRDENMWQILRENVIPNLVEKTESGKTLKVWDVACSTGEEAYSLAMYFHEEIKRQDKTIDLKIFATDIAEKHLDMGSQGLYAESVVADVSPELLQQYFIRKNNLYQVIEKIRRSVIFSKHNIIKNPPFSQMDMVMCRNLLIYFQTPIQKKALNVLHFALKEQGVLVLGTSESVQTHREYFEEISRKWKIYKNVYPRKRLKAETLRSAGNRQTPSPTQSIAKERLHSPKNKLRSNKQKYINELAEAILSQFGGASVFIDVEYTILQAVGEFRKYASLPVSGFSTNLLDMLPTDLKHAVQASVKKSIKKEEKVRYENASYQKDGETKALDLIVHPFKQHNLEHEISLVIHFIEKEVKVADVEPIEKVNLSKQTEAYISNLEDELKETKEELQHSLEEIETSNEELQAANEELLASNEELQSTNEELQSVNEEINTVNAENIQKMDDLAQLNADMNNLLESTDIGTIFLDKNLRIRKFTPAIQKHFSLLNADVGRPIDNFTTSFGVTPGKDLVSRCKKVIKTGKTLERNILSKESRNYLQRISPFLNSDGQKDGVVITFVDIESLQKAKNKLVASEKRFKSFYEEDPVMHFSVDPNNSLIVQCNIEAVKKLGYSSKDEIIGKPIFELYEDESQLKALKLNKVFQEKGELKNIEHEMLTKKGDIIPVIMHSTTELDEHGNIVTNRFTCVDVAELKETQDELQKQKADLERINRDLEQFVSICSHDLQEPLSTIKFGSDILGKIYGDRLDEKGRNYIAYIDEASDRLSNQIKALLEHSRIGRDTQKKSVDTQELVEVVKYDLGKRIRDTKASVHIGSLPKIKGYEVELRLLFQNLLSNALKYIDKNRKPEIRISAYPEGEYWVFSVMDNGIGISKEDQQTIFTIFNRVPSEEKYEGTGVGLAHVEKIVLLHEGSLWVDSQLGVGSTFYIKLKAK